MDITIKKYRWRLILAGIALAWEGSACAGGETSPGLWVQGLSSMILGGSNYAAVQSDYDGDRLADPAVFFETNPSTGSTNSTSSWQASSPQAGFPLREDATVGQAGQAGEWRALLSSLNYAEVGVTGWGSAGCRAVPADYDGDNKADPAVYLASTGAWQAWLSGAGYVSAVIAGWGGPGFSPAPADYDGDGKTDPAVYSASNPSTGSASSPQAGFPLREDATVGQAGQVGTWRAWLSSAGYASVTVANWGGESYSAAPADYDGDRRADPSVYAGSLAIWRAWMSRSGYPETTVSGLGGAGDLPAPADYDGDGWADVALYTESTGNWKILLSGSGYLETNVICGGPGYQPVPGDYDGSGSADLAVYQPFTGIWSFAGGAASGRVFYVAVTGNDSNDGSVSSPWATPGFGSRQLQAGDTLIVMGGTYAVSLYDQDDIVPPSGAVNAWVTIRGQTGNRPKIEGSQGLRAAVDIGGRSYVRIENLELTSAIDNPYTGGLGQGIEAGGSAAGAGDISNVILKDLDIHHIEQGGGINFSGDMQSVQLIGTRIAYCTLGAIGAPASYGRGGWRNVVISNCYVGYSGHFYNGVVHDDQSLYDRPDGIGMENSDGPLIIAYTTAEHNFGDGLDSKSANTTIDHCIVANNSCDGVKLWRGTSRVVDTLIYGRGDGNSQTTPWAAIVIGSETAGDIFEIVNVTVDDEVGQNYVMAVQYDNPAVPLALALRNTIISSRGPNGQVYLADSVAGTLAHNLFYMPNSSVVLVKGSADYTAAQVGLLGAGNLYGNPLFYSTGFGGAGDYHTQAGSPAIDSGTASGAPATDLENTPRPLGAGYDIGCYER